MRRRFPVLIALAAVAAAAFATAAPALAGTGAAVTPSRACYVDTGNSTKAFISVSGFAAGASLQVTVDGFGVANATAGADGTVSGTIPVPKLDSLVGEKQHVVRVTDGATTVQSTFSTTRIRGDFTPSSGNPATLKVSFSVFGMNLAKPSQRVYVHYIAPGGHYKTTISIGKAKGPCGHITSTKKRRIFPFKAKHGKWTLQYDTSKRYHRGTSKTKYPWATVTVRVRSISIR